MITRRSSRPETVSRSLAAAAVALLAGAAPAQTGAGGGSPPPESYLPELGRAFVARHCPEEATLAACTLDDVLARAYVRARLGTFVVFYPAQVLADLEQGADLEEIARALLALQTRWIQLLGFDAEAAQRALGDAELVDGWVQGWEPAALSRLARGGERELFASLGAPGEVRAAAASLEAALASVETLGLAPQFTDGIPIVLCPTRRDFAELVGYLGLADPAFRASTWVEGIDQWTQCWSGMRLLLCLEYAPWTGFDPEFRQGIGVREFSPTGLSQHVAQHAAEALIFRSWNRTDLRLYEKGLAVNLVIDAIGECNTLDGEGGISNTGGSTAPYSRFVPGGNSSGGYLPPIPAGPLDAVVDSPWREGRGADHFAAALRAGQKEGAKIAAKDKRNPLHKDKTAHFLLNGPGKVVVSAPFFGPLAMQKPYPPGEVMDDYREFFRSYSSAFLHWLRTQGAGSGPESADRFREVLRQLAATETPETPEAPADVSAPPFHEVVERVFELPLSAADGSTDTLEWRFLKWVAAGEGPGKRR